MQYAHRLIWEARICTSSTRTGSSPSRAAASRASTALKILGAATDMFMRGGMATFVMLPTLEADRPTLWCIFVDISWVNFRHRTWR
ncbi:hypothetical protein GCM10010149_87060 [Nonomuraea roseoviolacea subsp. roseoviolacea]